MICFVIKRYFMCEMRKFMVEEVNLLEKVIIIVVVLSIFSVFFLLIEIVENGVSV